MVILEMLCAGTPVVASDVGGIADLVRSGVNGQLFSAGDSQALADCLGSLLDSAESLASLRREAARSVAHLSWSQVAQAHLQVLEQAAMRGRLRASA